MTNRHEVDRKLSETCKAPCPAPRRAIGKRIVILALFVGAVIAFFAFDLDRYVNIETLRENRIWLKNFVAENTLLAALIFMAVYAVATAFSLPGGTVLSIAGGFLFGLWLGCLLVVTAATIGATALFLAARTALGEPLKARCGPWLDKMSAGFRENELSYMLVLRLVPLFPFFVVNLVPAFLGVSLRSYVLATFFGIIPGAIVYISVGAGLGKIFDAGGEFTLRNVLTPEIVIALTGLAVLALLPVVYKKIKKRRYAGKG